MDLHRKPTPPLPPPPVDDPGDHIGILVTGDTTKAEIEEAIETLAKEAARLPAIVGWREWDKRHCRIDSLLGYWRRMP